MTSQGQVKSMSSWVKSRSNQSQGRVKQGQVKLGQVKVKSTPRQIQSKSQVKDKSNQGNVESGPRSSQS